MHGPISRAILLSLLFIIPFSLWAETRVNINTAPSAELQTLNGIGPAKAQAIIDYRNGPNGPFENIEEIKNVSGIGEATFANNKDLITVGVTPPSSNTSPSTSSAPSSSTHYSSNSVSESPTEKVKISLSAGRDRLGSVGSPLEFKAETNISYSRGNIFRWNFGDGNAEDGETVTHTYEYPGEYVVVLNASFSEGDAVSRINVKITEPDLVISKASLQRIEIKNNSRDEVNLFGRGVILGEKIYLFPRDTILKGGQSISFSSRVTGLSPSNLNQVSLIIVGENRDPIKIVDGLKKEKALRISDIEKEIASLRTQMASMPRTKKAEIETPATSSAEASNFLVAGPAIKATWIQTLKRFLFGLEKQ